MFLPPDLPGPPSSDDESSRIRAALYKAFTPHAPIDNKLLFAGRRDQIRRLIQTIASRGQHAIVYGERGVGKTSLVTVLGDFLRQEASPAIVVRVNCDKSDDFSSLWRKVFAEVYFTQRRTGLRNYSEKSDVLLGELIPDSATPDDIRRLLSLVSEKEEFVAIFDEFDRFADQHGRALFADTIKAISDYAVAATLVLVGVADSVESLLNEHLSLGRNLAQVPMPRMTVAECKEIIDKALAKGGGKMAMADDAKNYTVGVARGLPYYVHLLGQCGAHEALNSGQNCISVAHVVAGMQAAMQNTMSTIKSHYQQALRSARTEKYLQVLLACAFAQADELGFFTASSVRRPLEVFLNGRAAPVSTFARHLERLCDPKRGALLDKQGEPHRYAYRFKDSLVPPYVIMRGVGDGLVTTDMLVELSSDGTGRPQQVTGGT